MATSFSAGTACQRAVTVVLSVLAATALAACSPKPATRLVPTANPETSWKLITPPDAPHYTLQPGQSATLPRPEIGHFAPPVYPASLAHRGMPPVVVKAQLTFGRDGKAAGVYVLSDSYAGPGRTLFEDAVRTAAMGWAFTPLVFESWSDAADATGTLQRTAKPFSLWFEFRFAMVDGKPIVETVKR